MRGDGEFTLILCPLGFIGECKYVYYNDDGLTVGTYIYDVDDYNNDEKKWRKLFVPIS